MILPVCVGVADCVSSKDAVMHIDAIVRIVVAENDAVVAWLGDERCRGLAGCQEPDARYLNENAG